MKNYIFTLLIAIVLSCKGQENKNLTYDNFENQILTYKPQQNKNVSNKDFNYATMILNETKSAVKNNPKNFNVADYFNVLSALLTLKKSSNDIKVAFNKFKDSDDSCEYILNFENIIEKNKKYDIIREEYNKELAKCKEISTYKKKFDIQEYCTSNKLDLQLVSLIEKLKNKDQKHRNKNEAKSIQRKLDIQNQKSIDSIFSKYNSYIGKSLVGKKYESVMWAVIQHSNIEMMEKYLPIIHKAVQNKELSEAPLKMLIDRFYGLKYGYQVFGSQQGFNFKLANEAIRNEIKKKYNID